MMKTISLWNSFRPLPRPIVLWLSNA